MDIKNNKQLNKEENKISIYTESNIELSECEDSPDCLDIKFIICDFLPNFNKVQVDRKHIEEWMNSIIFKPIVGKISKIPFKKLEDFTSHQAKKIKKKDGNGNTYNVTELNTDAFGTFYDVYIEEIDGEEYLCAKGKIWKRFKKAVEILQRKINNNEKIASSWEIDILDKEFITVDGEIIKNIIKGNFIGHCLLGYSEKTGQRIYGAYDSSEVLECAEIDKNSFEYQLSEAILEDIKNINNEDIKGGKEMNKEDNIEVSSLTMTDISKKLNQAIWESEEFGYDYWVFAPYPLENRVIVKKYGKDVLDEDFVEINYEIDEKGKVTLKDSTEVKMVFISKTESDTQLAELTIAKEKIEKELSQVKEQKEVVDREISNLKITLSEKEEELSSKNTSICELGKNITNKETLISEKEEIIKQKDIEISELKPYKEQIDEINKEKAEKELSEKRETFKQEYMNTKLISNEDLEVSEVKEAIEKMDSKAMELYIAQKVIAKAKAESEFEKSQGKEIEVSEVNGKIGQAETTLNSITNIEIDSDAFRKAFSK